MNQERLKYLLECYWLKQCSESEMKELDEWFHAHNPGNVDMDNWLNEAGGTDNLSKKSYVEFKQRVKVPVKMTFSRICAVAAALLITVSAGYLLLNKNSGKMLSLPDVESTAKSDIGPGGNKATLILSSGRTIVLNGAKLGKLAEQGNASIRKSADSSISYRSIKTGQAETKVHYNTLVTPRGGKYSLTLSDGTEVTLDASSSITFPVAFNGIDRRVNITGQAYFKVVHNAERPFYVLTKGHVIKDIGTEFNVDSYEDEPSLKVTLAEGLVEVSNSSSTVSLIPGQQAQVNPNKQRIEVKAVKVADVIAWKNGWFVFHHEPIANVMKQASRWYDVDIYFEGKAITKTFGGNISKYKNISELLENLKITGGINYRIEGRRVTLIN